MDARSDGVLDGRYLLREVIGDGATAVVWRATDTRLDRDVALKVVRAGALDATGRARARAESLALARFTHPNLVTVYDAHIADDDPDAPSYVVLELVEGRSLRDALEDGPLHPPETARIGAAVANALVALHDHGVVHRDVKPANVLLGAAGAVKVADLGIARFADATRLTGSGLLVGTPAYLAPEQVEGGAVTGAADVYALGLVLLECLTGERAFEGSGLEGALARLHRDPHVPAALPSTWCDALHAMLQRDPARRAPATAVPLLLADLEHDVTPTKTAVLPLPLEPTVATVAPFVLAPVGASTGAAGPAATDVGASVVGTSALGPTDVIDGDAAGTTKPRRLAVLGAMAAALVLVVALAVSSSGGVHLPTAPSPSPAAVTTAPVAQHPVLPAVVRSVSPPSVAPPRPHGGHGKAKRHENGNGND